MPPKKSNYSSLTGESLTRLQLAEVARFAKSSRRKSRYRSGSMQDSFKAQLAGFDFAKASYCKITSNAPLVSFCIENNHASEYSCLFEKKYIYTYVAKASLKRNTVNTIKQLISF